MPRDDIHGSMEIGDRVEIHPACDAWMMGHAGTITAKIGERLRMAMDHPGIGAVSTLEIFLCPSRLEEIKS